MATTLRNTAKGPIGVIGSGSFGTVIANLLAENHEVLLYTRRESVLKAIRDDKVHNNQPMHANVKATMDLEEVTSRCTLIFPLVPSKHFRSLMKDLAKTLQPYHILIHGIKGLDVVLTDSEKDRVLSLKLPLNRIKTMSQVILEESPVLRVGCISGPNLSKEIAKKLPAGTVIASHFDEVIALGKWALRSERFMVFENHDLIGVELAGVLKNILALGSGMISGLGLGENARALMITRGWREMMRISELFGSNRDAYMGLAGIGDMIATCSSPMSRNYTVGFRLAQGESLDEIIASMDEVAEGVNTVRTTMALMRNFDFNAPLTKAFHSVLFEGESIEDAIRKLIAHRHGPDVDS